MNKKSLMKMLVLIMTAGYLTLLFLFTESLDGSRVTNQGERESGQHFIEEERTEGENQRSDVEIEQNTTIEEEEAAKAPFPQSDFATPQFQIMIIGLGIFMVFVGIYTFFIRKDKCE